MDYLEQEKRKNKDLVNLFYNILDETTGKGLKSEYKKDWKIEYPFYDKVTQPLLFASLYQKPEKIIERREDLEKKKKNGIQNKNNNSNTNGNNNIPKVYTTSNIAELIWMITTFDKNGNKVNEVDNLKIAVKIIKKSYTTNELNDIDFNVICKCQKEESENPMCNKKKIYPCLWSLYEDGNLNRCEQGDKSLNCPVAWMANALLYIENNYARLKMPKNCTIEDIEEFDDKSYNLDDKLLEKLFEKYDFYSRIYIESIDVAYVKWYYAKIFCCPTSKQKAIAIAINKQVLYEDCEYYVYTYLQEALEIIQSFDWNEILNKEDLVKDILVSKITSYTLLFKKNRILYEPIQDIIESAKKYEELFNNNLNKLAVCTEILNTLVITNCNENNSFKFFNEKFDKLNKNLNDELQFGSMDNERKKMFYLLKLRSLLYQSMTINAAYIYQSCATSTIIQNAVNLIEQFNRILSDDFTKSNLRDNINTYTMYKVMYNNISSDRNIFKNEADYNPFSIKTLKDEINPHYDSFRSLFLKMKPLKGEFFSYYDQYGYCNIPSCKISEYMHLFGEY